MRIIKYPMENSQSKLLNETHEVTSSFTEIEKITTVKQQKFVLNEQWKLKANIFELTQDCCIPFM